MTSIKKDLENSDLTIIIPTLNEADNIELLISRLINIIDNNLFEIIFVDDSDDLSTREILKRVSSDEDRVRVVFRENQRGLSSAIIDGLQLARYEYILVMDADLQHDERIIPKMLNLIKSDSELDLIIGSRYADGGEVVSWNTSRHLLSLIGSIFSRILIRNNLKDPLSGFFIIRKTFFKSISPNLMRSGFKILLDIFISSRTRLNFKEVPFSFKRRHSGYSKLSLSVIASFYLLLIKKILKTSPRY